MVQLKLEIYFCNFISLYQIPPATTTTVCIMSTWQYLKSKLQILYPVYIYIYFILIIFADEPGKPSNVQVVDWDKDHADLKWIKPESDGGAPITGYIIEFKVSNM